MFKPTSAKDRLNYGEVLMPPPGYKLEHAIGTTYSLDLETLTAVSITLGLVTDTDSELINNPISLLSALQKVSDKIVVFCESGQTKLPQKANPFCLMLEKMVVPVSMPFDRIINRYPAFHPKTWLLEFSNTDGKKKYRVVIMSRNMTFDHSWDVAYFMDGEPAEEDAGIQPLIDFLRFLRKQLNKKFSHHLQQDNILAYMINAVSTVRFSPDAAFSEFMILPLGIGANGYDMSSDPLLTDNFHELVIMSPFLTGSVIGELNDGKKSLTGTKRTLITRRTELPKIQGEKASNFDIYVMRDKVFDVETSISDGEENHQEETSKQDIHAKVYIRRKNNAVDLYLGSMNASYAAIHSNVEMMIRLRTKGSILNGEIFLDDIMGAERDGRNPFEKVVPGDDSESEETSVQNRVEQVIKKVCHIRMTAEVEKYSEAYNIKLSAGTKNRIEGVTIRPLRSDKECGLESMMVFQGMQLLQLSEFYVVSATIEDYRIERVIMVPTSGIPETRDEEIIRDVITSRKQFLDYVAFILGDDYIQSYLENQKTSGVYGEWGTTAGQSAVYEKMLRTAVTDPDRIKEIQYITRAVNEEGIIPEEFREMYHVFCDTLDIKQE